MSVLLNPSQQLSFQSTCSMAGSLYRAQLLGIGPLTSLVKRSLSISNPNNEPVAFKVKTTAPKVRMAAHNPHWRSLEPQLYCVRPNSGRIEPNDTVDVLGTRLRALL